MANRPEKKVINGWLIVDKPIGMGSTKVVSAVKRILHPKKVGHAGTLDPLASGVLPIALGEATKTVQFAMDSSKTYRFTVTFGAQTDTDDTEGKIIETTDILPTKEQIEAILPEFLGTIEQIPPAFSAIKVDGKRSYDLARMGKAKELKPREVKIESFRLLNFNPTLPLGESKSRGLLAEGDSVRGSYSNKKEDKCHFTPHPNPLPKGEGTNIVSAEFEVTCGKGTYIRALARDLAQKCGSLGHISTLTRTRVGTFKQKDAISLEKLEKLVYKGALLDCITPVQSVLDDIPVLDLDPDFCTRLRHGQSVDLTTSPLQESTKTVCATSEGKLVAIGEMSGSRLKPLRVFNL